VLCAAAAKKQNAPATKQNAPEKKQNLTAKEEKSKRKAEKPKKQDVTANKTSGRVCDLTGKRANNGYVVTFSHTRNKKMQQVNLQRKRVYWPEGKRWVKLRICTKV
jgi:ribosomal protein L28